MLSSSIQYIIDETGNKISVILPVSEYQQMQEDLHDLVVIAERKCEDTLSIAEMRKRIGEKDYQ